MLRRLTPGRFLEIGYGEGDFLVTLAKMGFAGDGYDPSQQANLCASRNLCEAGVHTVNLLPAMPSAEQYDYIFFFEVIGYFEDPRRELAKMITLLKPGGRLLFQIEKVQNYGYPFINILRPLHTLSHKSNAPASNIQKQTGTESTGIRPSGVGTRIATLVLNRVTLLPFLWLQLLFAKTSLGNGFIVLARAGR
jgi:SAM-dependent methyltransferase